VAAAGGGVAGYYAVDVERVQAAGFDLPFSAGAARVKEQLDLLSPTVDKPMHSAVSVFDDQDGLTWTLTFGANDGDVPQLACNVDTVFPERTARCEATTMVDGNTLGGTFLLSGSKAFAFDVSAADMASELASLDGLGNDVEVSRTPLDGRGGYAWTITFKNALGDLPLLDVSSSLTGTGASLAIAEVQKGNQLRGSFALTLDGHTTELLAYDATAAQIEAALEALDSCGSVVVSQVNGETATGGVDTEGGRAWTVTFHDVLNPGDVPALKPVADLLTGKGAAVLVRELVKGSEASGNEAKLSFEAPPYCSMTPTKAGVCGDPVTSYTVEWDTTDDFGTSNLDGTSLSDPAMLYRVQRIVTEAPAKGGIGGYHSRGMAGTFKLSYGGEVTSALPAHATATEVRHAIEALSTVDTVRVTRTYSAAREPLDGFVDLTYGSPFVTCGNASAGGSCGLTDGTLQVFSS